MNYYFPYGTIPYIEQTAKTGLLSKIFKNGINWSSILSNTQKTLNIVNQTIPVIKQMGPMVNNAKTMFKIMNEFKKIDTPKKEPKEINQINEPKETINNKQINYNNPTFFQ
ncbi:MAG: VrrA/YqfQ family protein [Bacilli bacterium]